MKKNKLTLGGHIIIVFAVIASQFALGFGSIVPVQAKSESAAAARQYYVSPTGNDANAGTSDALAWKTLKKVNATNFQPGDVISFKRGGSWTGGLVVDNSGVQGTPITFTAYGSGAKPVFTNPGSASNYTNSIVVSASWVVVDGFTVSNAQYAGVYISNTAAHDVVKNMEATNVGAGIQIRGQHNLVTKNYIHDLHMVRNTPGGTDDSGAMGVSFIDGSSNEVSYNRMERCIATSYDFGKDGGVVEFFGTSNANYVHHNWGSDSNGFAEVGGGTALNNILAYNVSVNNGGFTSVHLSDGFSSVVKNFRVENNTIIETTQSGWVPFGFVGNPAADTFLLRNNIVYISKFLKISNKSGFTHTNNLYFLAGGTVLGYTLAAGEAIGDPQFVNLAGRDFHLKVGSPAINKGGNLSYTLDFEKKPVPSGSSPDMGSYEYQVLP